MNKICPACEIECITCGECRKLVCPDCDCDVLGSCAGNVFCNSCGTEIDSDDGTPHVCTRASAECVRVNESLGIELPDLVEGGD